MNHRRRLERMRVELAGVQQDLEYIINSTPTGMQRRSTLAGICIMVMQIRTELNELQTEEENKT